MLAALIIAGAAVTMVLLAFGIVRLTNADLPQRWTDRKVPTSHGRLPAISPGYELSDSEQFYRAMTWFARNHPPPAQAPCDPTDT